MSEFQLMKLNIEVRESYSMFSQSHLQGREYFQIKYILKTM